MLSDPLAAGTAITGKWNGRRYVVVGHLGCGSGGDVYLADSGANRVALKIGNDSVDLQSEINTLQQLQEAGAIEPGFLSDVDDWLDGEWFRPFYAMRYVEGEQLHTYIQKHGRDWIPVVGVRLLSQLKKLHDQEFVFGDLKPENILVSRYGMVKLIDYGGVGHVGEAVRQFTECYDRGYWQAGSRKAEATYDLFSFAVLFLELALDKTDQLHHVLPQNRGVENLVAAMKNARLPEALKPVIRRALFSEYRNAQEMLTHWKEASLLLKYHAPAVHMPWMKPTMIGSLAVLLITLMYAVR